MTILPILLRKTPSSFPFENCKPKPTILWVLEQNRFPVSCVCSKCASIFQYYLPKMRSKSSLYGKFPRATFSSLFSLFFLFFLHFSLNCIFSSKNQIGLPLNICIWQEQSSCSHRWQQNEEALSKLKDVSITLSSKVTCF